MDGREAKVDDLDSISQTRGEDEIGGLHIAVRDAEAVDVGECARHLHQQRRRQNLSHTTPRPELLKLTQH